MARKQGFVAYSPGPVGGASLQELVAQLQLELLNVSAAFDNLGGGMLIVPYSAAPEKIRPLMLVYADGTNWNPGSGEGVYIRNLANSAWKFLG